MNKIIIAVIGIIVILCSCNSKEKKVTKSVDYKSQWVDNIYKQMSLEEKVGQLFMIATYSNRDSRHIDSIQELINNQHIGGLIFFQGGPVRQDDYK